MREGPAGGNIDGVYARSSGNVWVKLRCKIGTGAMKRYEVVQVVGAVWLLMEGWGVREVRGAEVRRGGVVAGFEMRFLMGEG